MRGHISVCLSVTSVTVMHRAKAIGWNEMPFGRDAHVVPSNTVFDRGPSPATLRGDWGS